MGDRHRSVLRAVFGEDHLVVPGQMGEPLTQVDDRSMQDPLLVVDGNDERNSRGGLAHPGEGSGLYHRER